MACCLLFLRDSHLANPLRKSKRAFEPFATLSQRLENTVYRRF